MTEAERLRGESIARLDGAALLYLVATTGIWQSLDTLLDEVEGPTTACFECGVIVPIGDTFLSKVDQRALCEGCFRSRKERRLAKEVPA